jgi:AcrR family transcriptional regulator
MRKSRHQAAKALVCETPRTRARLLKTAITMFSAKGWHGVSVDEVVAAAKVKWPHF